ncbi:MarR family winged helix-turn-helix transcriptional regulator [Cryobacterium luteum]|uniref:MarR family transcriptional regulator n=1 Tax=Cryobacterium luteum TaxID=1424661 RepID=A0A1H8DFW0_9MICO|nr:MarR family transcriptional regulator [Cryobacterium luteum]TFB82499.1 MarR family transcriptional regulator [Cryobacterium luteum]SEN06179.1 DNA-binding transcriptional regulator, MarR family [Cryobacterium luteum]
MLRGDEWDKIDASLIRMRRLLQGPKQVNGVADLSAVLVVDAIVRRRAHGERTRISDIAGNLSVKPSTASRLVAATENAGFVERLPGRDDPRSVNLDLTPTGEELNATAKQFRIDFLRRAAPRWDAHTVAVFADLLDEFSRAAAAGPAGAGDAP